MWLPASFAGCAQHVALRHRQSGVVEEKTAKRRTYYRYGT
eukprot:CAMPEP_0116967004 /NCGR_PEP_ID=MMETSP0467-20121206/50251_1 /TAXON_ID=283647 /ORGANISM="Mesodinium pulex, Strain SPMC105" /LENGTH=39 /DNA_ID= /DNA_START= /DNA_END= /DNA_ORIENTATION=